MFYYCYVSFSIRLWREFRMFREWRNGLGGRLPFPPVDKKSSFSAIGDTHGRADLLERALNICKGRQITCVGDHIDPGSAGALRSLHARPDVTCLSGNHQEMMLDFLEASEEYGKPLAARWRCPDAGQFWHIRCARSERARCHRGGPRCFERGDRCGSFGFVAILADTLAVRERLGCPCRCRYRYID